jgi:hypothetical protein
MGVVGLQVGWPPHGLGSHVGAALRSQHLPARELGPVHRRHRKAGGGSSSAGASSRTCVAPRPGRAVTQVRGCADFGPSPTPVQNRCGCMCTMHATVLRRAWAAASRPGSPRAGRASVDAFASVGRSSSRRRRRSFGPCVSLGGSDDGVVVGDTEEVVEAGGGGPGGVVRGGWWGSGRWRRRGRRRRG